MTSNVPWNKPLIRAINRVLDKDPLTRPHLGRVPGVGQGRSHANHGLAEPNTKEAWQARKGRETQVLRGEMAELERSIPLRVETEVARRVEDEVATKVNEILPCVVQSLMAYFQGVLRGRSR